MRLKELSRLFAVLLLFYFLSILGNAQSNQAAVLVTASSETDSTTSATGAATQVGGVVVGSAGENTSTYEHSEIWEVVRRFQAECPAASFTTNPRTPHDFTIHVDYQKVNGGLLIGAVDLYQLVLLDKANNPIYVSKKNWLRREIKPVCKAIRRGQ